MDSIGDFLLLGLLPDDSIGCILLMDSVGFSRHAVDSVDVRDLWRAGPL